MNKRKINAEKEYYTKRRKEERRLLAIQTNKYFSQKVLGKREPIFGTYDNYIIVIDKDGNVSYRYPNTNRK